MNSNNLPEIYLASKSPRRQELLTQVGICFKLISVNVDETPHTNEAAYDYVQRLAEEKATAGTQQLKQPSGIAVLGADTIVTLDQEVFGKPQNFEHARDMLMRLSGRSHQVMTSVAIARGNTKTLSIVQTSQVTFTQLNQDVIENYWASKEPWDKAGAYAIQGLGAAFISHLEGSYSGVMGLPIYETIELMNKAGLRKKIKACQWQRAGN